MSSDVAAICQQIEYECLAMKAALSGYAVTSRHEIITHRFQTLGQHQQRLINCVGEQEAVRICYETYAHVISTPDGYMCPALVACCLEYAIVSSATMSLIG